jgi:hypothetical protein
MPTTVTAVKGDTLCTIAINNGLNDCTPLRALDANSAYKTRALVAGDVVTVPDLNPSDNSKPTDAQHQFQIKARQVGIRFVHGSAKIKYADDLELTELNISNYNTNLCGIPEGPQLPDADHAHFDANADKDVDAFKVEVLDTRPPSTPLEVLVEPLVPTYDSGGTVSGHNNFPGDPKNSGTVRGVRALIGQAYNVEGKRYRTGYLRLVVDSLDTTARPKQTVLVTDNVSNNDTKTEILDQDVRATYVLKDCPVADDASKCRVETTAPLVRGSVVNVALHILRATATGVVETTPGGPGDDGVVKLSDFQGRFDTYCRDYWAQNRVKFKTVLARTVDLPSNMLTVSDASGKVAAGHQLNSTVQGQVGFTVNVQRFGNGTDANQDVSPILINAGDTPETTANAIATAVNGISGLTAKVSVNPAEVRPSTASQSGSADILISDGQNGRVTLTNLTAAAQQDQDQVVAINNVGLTFAVRNAFADYHVGSPDERNLYKTYDTGDDRLDIFVVNNFDSRPQLVGFTITAQTDADASRRPMSGMFNTIVMRLDASDANNGFPYALPHEIGHALLDCAMHADDKHELMFSITANPVDVDDSKRLIGVDPPATNWENMTTNASLAVVTERIRMNTETRVQLKSSSLLQS